MLNRSNPSFPSRWILLLVLLQAWASACQDDTSRTGVALEPEDPLTPPALDQPILLSATATNLTVRWVSPTRTSTSPTSEPAGFEVYYSREPIQEAELDQAMRVANPPLPGQEGAKHAMTLEGLQPDIRYYLAIRTVDEDGRHSVLRSPKPITTSADSEDEPPVELAPPALDQPIVLWTAATSVKVHWSTPARTSNPPTSEPTGFEVYYSREPILDSELDQAVRFAAPPLPGEEGARHEVTIENLSPGTRYHFAIRTVDESEQHSALRFSKPVTTSGTPGWWTGFAEDGGVDGTVHKLVEYDGRLIVAGQFTRAGEHDVRNIAAWDGSEWESMTNGIEAPVDLLIVGEDRLVAGSTSGGPFLEWSGAGWNPVADELPGVLNIAIWGGELYATVSAQASRPMSPGARWDGTEWIPLPERTPGASCRESFRNVLVHDDVLYFFGSRECPRFWEPFATILAAERAPDEEASDLPFSYRVVDLYCGLTSSDRNSEFLYSALDDEGLVYGIQGCAGSSCGYAQFVMPRNSDCANRRSCQPYSEHLWPLYTATVADLRATSGGARVVICDSEEGVIGKTAGRTVVKAMIGFGESLYVGGDFRSINDIPSAGIARWTPDPD